MHVKMADLIWFLFFPQEDEECRITTALKDFKLVLEINKTDVHLSGLITLFFLFFF